MADPLTFFFSLLCLLAEAQGDVWKMYHAFETSHGDLNAIQDLERKSATVLGAHLKFEIYHAAAAPFYYSIRPFPEDTLLCFVFTGREPGSVLRMADTLTDCTCRPTMPNIHTVYTHRR